MDTVYGTKKYFQSLSGASDIYRSPACRAVSNDYTYQNTLGRRSTLGAYYHMNNQPSYSNEHSVTNQYGYNTWGIWRDGRNVAPSTFSAKPYPQYQKTRSFSIILTTAAFIVLLAVISIAGLAFYFSSIKGNLDDPVLGFEGSFRIAKGDLFSTGLKYNHTSSYKQKIDFYKRFVERALSDQGLLPLKTDVWGFGEGPLIKVNFRTFFDVRKLPQNIHNVEEFIKEAIFLETTAVKSLYRALRIDSESVEIKRILDEQVVKSASLFKETPSAPTSQTQLEKRLMKKGGSPPTLINKPASASSASKSRANSKPHSPDEEPDVDVENAPVIQGSFEGSFEITKTDADIARKKTTPTRAYAHSSLPPKAVTPYALRVKPKKPGIEKLTTILPQFQSLPTSTSTARTTYTSTEASTTTLISSTTSTTKTTTTPKPMTTTTTTTTTTTPTTTTTTTTLATTTTAATTPATSTTPPTTTTTTPKPTTVPSTTIPSQTKSPHGYHAYPTHTTSSAGHLVPKLDQNLFNTVPVLDTQPWRPIHREVPEFLPGPPPSFPTKTLPTMQMPVHSTAPPQIPFTEEPSRRRLDEIELPFLPEEPRPPIPMLDQYGANFFGPAVRKPDFSGDAPKNPQEMVFYHSFGNPVFMPGSEGIERLGVGVSVQPHQLPVPLIDDVVIPPFKPLHPTMITSDKLPFDIEPPSDKFEHLGDGVIAKKPESATLAEPEVVTPTTTTNKSDVTQSPADDFMPTTRPSINDLDTSSVTSELADKIGEFFMELLDLPKDNANKKQDQQPLESRTEKEEDSVTLPNKQAIDEGSSSTQEAESSTQEQTTESSRATTGKPNFLNIKELILKRNQQLNQRVKSQIASTTPIVTSTTVKYTTTSPTTSTVVVPTTTDTPTTPTMPTTPTTPNPTMQSHRNRPSSSKPPTMLDDSNLFPSHSKWPFTNNSNMNPYGHNGNVRKVFNTTLQAWVSEDVEKTENLTLDELKTKINNATNIQDISFIFDTLASKLGITPSVPTKVPSFAHKLKTTQQGSDSRGKITATTTSTTRTTRTPPTTTTPSTTTIKPTTSRTVIVTRTTTPKQFVTTTPTTTSEVRSTSEEDFVIERREPFIKPMSSFIEDSSSEGVGAAIPVVGEAEVEVIDPTKYEEMLKSSQFADPTTTETTPKLVTLLPVRSNSGIRTYKPFVETGRSSVSSTSSTRAFATPGRKKRPSLKPHITRRKNTNQSRRFPPAEAVIRGGLKVTVK